MKPNGSFAVLLLGGLSIIVSHAFAQAPNEKTMEPKESAKAEKNMDDLRNECRKKANEQMITGQATRTFMVTCIEELTKKK